MHRSTESHHRRTTSVVQGILLALFLCLGVAAPDWFTFFHATSAEAAVTYVTPGGAGARNGSNWGNAFGEAEFPAAIQSADAGDEFWVAAGAYRPVIPADPSSVTAAEQEATFTLKDGVALYGGFSAPRRPAQTGTRASTSQSSRVT